MFVWRDENKEKTPGMTHFYKNRRLIHNFLPIKYDFYNIDVLKMIECINLGETSNHSLDFG